MSQDMHSKEPRGAISHTLGRHQVQHMYHINHSLAPKSPSVVEIPKLATYKEIRKVLIIYCTHMHLFHKILLAWPYIVSGLDCSLTRQNNV
jgi:gentisate 1,2-dioxygenase